ncbi:patatin-like phospholipase family protein [Microbacterium rhizosphaerae]|uniref:Patatin-like phospholipase family protein n=1 Tax=Microbacterium rhizosphaerae TaxID=1678237 RepID=A0ABZ0SK17_9MICO|nr:patatin-like phospholipase family protein [Microbacterium rhizosphaerae]WPR88505.1 patatin-like phospholipase family protein [Microbacterium rhizosphaerae]
MSTSSPTPHDASTGNWPMPDQQFDVARSGRAGERALVIAGGGAAGNAWALGVIAGLADGGVDVSRADLVIGTSSGSTVAAQITSGTRAAELYASILAEQLPVHGSSPRRGPAGGVSGQSYLDWSNAVIASASDASDMRRRMGAAALERDASDGADGMRWRDVVAGRLPRAEWPEQRVLITSVDARTGEPVVFDRDSGVDLVDAVAASTSAMNPYPIGANRYLNGSYRRGENADLAAGHGRVLILVPFGGRTRVPQEWGMDLSAQVADLQGGGSVVETVFPDASTRDLFDANALDPATRLQAAHGGYEQGHALAPQLADFWS